MIDFSSKPTLVGEKVLLRPFEQADAEKMLVILDDPEIKRLTGSVVSDLEVLVETDAAEAEKIRNWYLTRNSQTDRLDLAVVDKQSGELVGEVVFNEYEEDIGQVNFRTLIGPAGRGRGLGTEALALLVRYGFEELGLNRIELEVYSFNPRAEAVYRKNGFVLEGIKRESFKYNGVYINTKLFAMLRSDYDSFVKNRGAL